MDEVSADQYRTAGKRGFIRTPTGLKKPTPVSGPQSSCSNISECSFVPLNPFAELETRGSPRKSIPRVPSLALRTKSKIPKPKNPMSKSKPAPLSDTSGVTAPNDPTPYRSNPEVDAKIDSFVKENPKYWSFVQGMPRERLERTLVLNEVRHLERQQRMRDGILKDIDRNPALKEAYETLTKDLPEDQRETVIAQLARQTRRTVARSQNQRQSQGQGTGS